MITIIITAIIVAAIGFILWKTKGFKSLREKNRAQEVKEQYQKHTPITELNTGCFVPTETAETTTEVNQSYTITNIMTIPHELPIKLPATVRSEIISRYDAIKTNIKDFDISYIHSFNNDIFEIKSKEDTVKSIKVINGEIEIRELSTRFVLLNKETSLFANLAREEFERRAVQDEIDVSLKLKGLYTI